MRYSKYRATQTVYKGIKFHSQGEFKRYLELKLLEAANKISELKLQPKYPLVVDKSLVCNYIADFEYLEDGVLITEDFKGMITPMFRLKRKLFEILYKRKLRLTFK